MAKLRNISPEELKRILADHKKWLESNGKEGEKAALSKTDLSNVNLSRANLSQADLSEVDLSEANLRGAKLNRAKLSRANLSRANLSRAKLILADLRQANLSRANLSRANLHQANLPRASLSGADLRKTDLSGDILFQACLSGADLSWADLSGADLGGANLRGAKLKGVDLSETVVWETKIREEDLSGVKYRPEQLKDMIIERPEKEPLIVPDKKGQLTIRLSANKPPLIYLTYLTAFIEYQYDILYILLFAQYDSFDKLQEILSGSPFHWLKDKDEAVKIEQLSTGSVNIVVSGIEPVWVLIITFAAYFIHMNLNKTDLLQRLIDTILKTKKKEDKEKTKEQIERFRKDTSVDKKELFENSREIDELPIGHLPPDEKENNQLTVLHDQKIENLRHQIERQQNDLSTRPPRKDCLEMVLLLREEGLLTNKLKDPEVANLLEVHMENFGREFESLRKQLGNFEMDIEEEEEKKE